MTHPIPFAAWWQALQIEQTTDVALIRRAYAARLKQVRPEDDPEGFQRLRGGYEAALEWARSQAREAPVVEAVDAVEAVDRVTQPDSAASSLADTASPASPRESADAVSDEPAEPGTEASPAIDIVQQAFVAFDGWLRSLPEEVWQYDRKTIGQLAQGNDSRVVDSFAEVRATPAFVQLEFAEAFEYHAMRFAAHQGSAPAIRMALADLYGWAEDYRSASRFGQDLANEALWRTTVDNMFAKFVHSRRHSSAAGLLLDGKRPLPTWRIMDNGALADMRKTLISLDGELRAMRDQAFEPELLDAWRAAVQRPRVTQAWIAYIAAFAIVITTLFGVRIATTPDSELLAYMRSLSDGMAVALIVGYCVTVSAVLGGITLWVTYRYGPQIDRHLRKLREGWNANVGQRLWFHFGWYGVATLTGVLSITGIGGTELGTPTAVVALSLIGAIWAVVASFPLFAQNLLGIVGILFFYTVATTTVWVSLVGRLDNWEMLNCTTMALGAVRLLPYVHERLRQKHENALAGVLAVVIAIGIAGVFMGDSLGWTMPTWLQVSVWLWCAIVNLLITIFFASRVHHWALLYLFWVVPGTGIALTSKLVPPYYAMIVGVVLVALVTLLLEMWRVWMAKPVTRRAPTS
ncbi:hypothetical protein [Pandoraea sp. NPDC090278]|uniref:hypothetical protein n=1 Tax=Pandoraea sp. NPDC090278 TaxID=3364391 RepID=UPI00383BCE07